MPSPALPRGPLRVALHVLEFIGLFIVGLDTWLFAHVTDKAMENNESFDPALTALSLLTLGALVTLWWYRSHPLVPLVAGVIVVALHGDPYLIVVALPAWLARMETPRQKIVTVVAYCAVLYAAVFHSVRMLSYTDPEPRKTGWMFIWGATIAAIALATVLGLYLRQRSRTAAATLEAARQTALAKEAAEEVRRRREREDLAREVHDTLASRLSAISLQSGSLENTAGPSEIGEAARNVRLNASRALSDLRTLLASIRDGADPQAPTADLLTDLDDLVDLFQDAEAAGLRVTPFVVLDGYTSAPDSVRRAVFRITQEALTNALRHSADHGVEVHIAGSAGKQVTLEFRNAVGKVGQFTDGAGRGLAGIDERVSLLGGTFTAGEEDGWFEVRAAIPWKATVGSKV